MRQFVSKVLHITHVQWMCRNHILHECERGCLLMQERQGVSQEIV